MSYPADPYWSYVKSLLHFDGVHGSTKMVDERHTAWTATGRTLTNLKSKFGNTSLNGDGINTSNVAANLGTWSWVSQDFAIEFWMFQRQDAGNANPCPFSILNASNAAGAWFTSNGTYAPGKLAFFLGPNSATVPLLISTSNLIFDQWMHVALTRSGSVMRLFVNGVLEASVTYTGATLSISTNCYISSGGGTTGTGFLGYINDFRYTLGVARYNANFTPPTEAFPHSGVVDPYYDKVMLHLPCDGEVGSSYFKDTKGRKFQLPWPVPPSHHTYAKKFGAISAAGHSPLKTTSTDYILGAEDFTFEFFMQQYFGVNSWAYHFEFRDAAGTAYGLRLSTVVGDSWVLFVNNLAAIVTYVGGDIQWVHVAISRSGGNIYLFVGGVLKGTYAIGVGVPVSTNGDLYLMGDSTGQSAGGGYPYSYDEIRFTKGYGRYTGTFTAPTEPFPQVGIQFLSGTVLDENSNPISRKVRAFRRSDALLTDTVMSDPTTGSFELRATDTSEHYVVVFDDSKNAMVYDHVVPVV